MLQLNEPDEALKTALANWVNDGVGGMAEIARNQHGIEDAEAVFALFETYVTKWDWLLQGIDRKDEAAVTALLKTNLFDRIDAATYGME